MLGRRVARLFSTSVARASHEPGGIPGVNLPFDISNKYKFTALFILYAGSACAIPFLTIRHHLTKGG